MSVEDDTLSFLEEMCNSGDREDMARTIDNHLNVILARLRRPSKGLNTYEKITAIRNLT